MQIFRNEEYIPNRVVSASEKEFFGRMEPHGHDFFELEYILAGEGDYTVDGECHGARAGYLFLMTPATVHGIDRSRLALINVMFRAAFCEEALSPLLAAGRVFCLCEKDAALVLPVLRELVAVHKRDADYALLLLRCVLHKLSANLPPQSKSTVPYIHRAMLYVQEHFRENLTLADTAAQLGLSYTYLSDLFLQETGTGFKAYLDGVRLSHAENLVRFSDLPIAEVCERSGFCDYANFSRRFRLRFGISPREMRKARQGLDVSVQWGG
jgi:AraC-like DNA-binding protein